MDSSDMVTQINPVKLTPTGDLSRSDDHMLIYPACLLAVYMEACFHQPTIELDAVFSAHSQVSFSEIPPVKYSVAEKNHSHQRDVGGIC